ncbi:MAG TPA: methyltransferase domain-containing protein [Candidatus Dormibacteraeota bacterium]|jgi:SAM-dependent methyltransferase
MSTFFRAAYLFGFKPWDSGVPSPELVWVVEGKDSLAPGRALDLGCGTGTNCVYLAQRGWEATGVDFVPRAIGAARRKAAAARVSGRFVVGDATRLTELGVGVDYRLLLDLGCFHSIPDAGRDAYVSGATEVAQPGATMLLFCFVRRAKPPSVRRTGGPWGPRGVASGEVAHRFASGWEMVAEKEGHPVLGWDAAWYRLRRR